MTFFRVVLAVILLGAVLATHEDRSIIGHIHDHLHPSSTDTPDNAADNDVVYKFHHFDARFRGESCRWVLAYAGVRWEDQRTSLALFPKLGSLLPVLEVNGKNISQSSAIARYIAKKHGFAGQNLFEQAQVDAMVDYIVIDAIAGFRGYLTAVLTRDMAKAQVEKEAFTNVAVVPFLQDLEQKLQKNNGGNGFFFGPRVTFADIIEVNFLDEVVRLKPTVLEPYPLLQAHRIRVHELKGIRQWLAKRPETPL